MTFDQILTALSPAAGLFIAGGIGRYYSYKAGKPKSAAEAQKINAEVVVTFAEGWRSYAEKLERRSEDLEKRLSANEHEITALQRAIHDQDEKNRETLIEKNTQIYDLQVRNRVLESRVNDLERELSKYKQAATHEG